MTYQQTQEQINNLNHKIKTQILTRKETQDLILQRELVWSQYIQM